MSAHLPLGELPLCSSDQIVRALERLGFRAAKTSGRKRRGSSHRSYVRESEGRKDVTVVVLGKNPVPRGTLKRILELGRVELGEFESALR